MKRLILLPLIFMGLISAESSLTGVGWTQYQHALTPLYKGLGNFDNNPLYQGGAILIFNDQPSERWDINLGAGLVFQNTAIMKSVVDTTGTQAAKMNPHSSGLGAFPFLYVANAKLHNEAFSVTLGQFDYRYSKYNSNFGNYLLQGPVYPNIIFTGFESAYPQVGLAGSLTMIPNITWDALVTFETQYKPLFDINLSSYLKAELGPIEIGAGINVVRAVEFNECATSPTNFSPSDADNDVDACLGGDPFGTPAHAVGILNGDQKNSDDFYPVETSGLWALADSVGVEPGTGATIYDTTFYSAAGTKLMGRFALDFKKFLAPDYGGSDKDMVLYSEVALLGLKDYKHVYEDKSERMPIMAGFNIPTMGFLDLLSLEVQYFNNPYPNNPSKMLGAYDPFSFSPVTFNAAFSPIPAPSSGDKARLANLEPYDTDADNFKWSLYLTKTIHEKIRFSGKLASDHWRIPNNNSVTSDVTVKPSQFYLSAKMEYAFK